MTSREAGTSHPAGRSTRRRPSVSHLLVVFAVVLAFVLNILALQGRTASVMVAIAARPIPAGSVLAPDMVRMVPVDANFGGLESLLGETDVGARYGWVVQRDIAGDGVIDRGALAEPASSDGFRAMSIPVPVHRAAGGTVVPGDLVDLIAVDDDVARFVVSGVRVLLVSGGGSGFAAVDHHVVVAVDASQALAIAEALAKGAVDVIRSTGAPSIDPADETDGEMAEDGT